MELTGDDEDKDETGAKFWSAEQCVWGQGVGNRKHKKNSLRNPDFKDICNKIF